MRPSVVWVQLNHIHSVTCLDGQNSDCCYDLGPFTWFIPLSLFPSSSPGHVQSTHQVSRRFTNVATHSRGDRFVVTWTRLSSWFGLIVSVGGHGWPSVWPLTGNLIRDRPSLPSTIALARSSEPERDTIYSSERRRSPTRSSPVSHLSGPQGCATSS